MNAWFQGIFYQNEILLQVLQIPLNCKNSVRIMQGFECANGYWYVRMLQELDVSIMQGCADYCDVRIIQE